MVHFINLILITYSLRWSGDTTAIRTYFDTLTHMRWWFSDSSRFNSMQFYQNIILSEHKEIFALISSDQKEIFAQIWISVCCSVRAKDRKIEQKVVSGSFFSRIFIFHIFFCYFFVVVCWLFIIIIIFYEWCICS